MRHSLAAALPLLAACAAVSPAPRSEERVVVISALAAERPSLRGLVEAALGAEDPRETLAREAERQLWAKGYRTVASLVVPGPVGQRVACGYAQVSSGDALRRLLSEHRADAALRITLSRLDASALDPLGSAEVELCAELFDRAGSPRWSASFRGPTQVSLYRARSDWRPHLRDALVRAMKELP
ncbi:MAG: hypothetical protein HYZ28_14270 [Myxococcales bacterium]|nr:hypothetical protein [Myxococcales bacterium]